MTRASLSHAALRRIVPALVDVELRRLGRRGAGRLRDMHELDSLERLGAMALLGEAFELDDPADGPGDAGTTEDWVAFVASRRPSRIVVRTSGSTGTPRACPHEVADLLDEARFFAGRFPGCRRVVALVPAHHLYGLIWTALLPDLLGVPVVQAEAGAMPPLRAGDLIVAVPDQWAALGRMRRTWTPGIMGASSAGALPDAVADTLMAQGLSRLVEIYGASETGGIGLRDVPETGFELLPRWRLMPGGTGIATRDGRVMALPDDVRHLASGRIAPAGRHDDAVKVGGHLVYPRRVAAFVKDVAGVEDAAVRLGADGRLKAFVVPSGDTTLDDLEARLSDAVGTLDPPERPADIRYGSVVPKSSMGKEMDWS